MLANIVGRPAPGLRLNEHIEEDGPIVFHHACKLRFEDIVSTWERLAVCFRSRALRIDSPAVVFSQTVLGFLCGGTGVIHLTTHRVGALRCHASSLFLTVYRLPMRPTKE